MSKQGVIDRYQMGRYVPGTVLGTEDTVEENREGLCPILVGKL